MKGIFGKRLTAFAVAALMAASVLPAYAVATEKTTVATEETTVQTAEQATQEMTDEIKQATDNTEQTAAETEVTTADTEETATDTAEQSESEKGAVDVAKDTASGLAVEVKEDAPVLEANAESDFEFDASTGTITKYIGSSTEVVIPETIGGVAVTVIGDNAFAHNQSITSVVIPNTVIKISNQGFYRCTSLEAVNVDSGNAVYKSVDGILYNKEITELLVYPRRKTGVVTIPEGVKKLPQFSECSLSSINIPASVVEIAGFPGCFSLTDINVAVGNNNFISIDGVVYSKDKTELVVCPMGKKGVLTIPEVVTYIPEAAFSHCISLTSVIIPEGISAIEPQTFYNCSSLTSVTIPKSVTRISHNAFQQCKKFSQIIFKGNAPIILNNNNVEQEAFYDIASNPTAYYYAGATGFSTPTWKGLSCEELQETNAESDFEFDVSTGAITGYKGSATEVEIPETINGVKVVSVDLSDNKQITSLNIPNGVEKVYVSGCSSLTELNIPDSVTDINVAYCSSLKSIEFPEEMDYLVSNFGGIKGCTSLETVIIGMKNGEITKDYFDDCKSLKTIIFKGNAPIVTNTASEFEAGYEVDKFNSLPNVTVYYYAGATGFTTPTWKGLPCVELEATGTDDTVTDNQPSQEQTSGNAVNFAQLSKEESVEAQAKVLGILNLKQLGANQSMFHYDITLVNTATGEVYTKDNFPKEGVTVTIAYPEGMNKNSHNYRVFHFANGTDKEPTEVTPLTLTDEGVQFHVYSLSPFTLVAEEKAAGTVSPKTSDSTNVLLLLAGMAVSGSIAFWAMKKKIADNRNK